MTTKKYWYFVSFGVVVDGKFSIRTDEFLVDEPITQIHQLDQFVMLETAGHSELEDCALINYQLLREV